MSERSLWVGILAATALGWLVAWFMYAGEDWLRRWLNRRARGGTITDFRKRRT